MYTTVGTAVQWHVSRRISKYKLNSYHMVRVAYTWYLIPVYNIKVRPEISISRLTRPSYYIQNHGASYDTSQVLYESMPSRLSHRRVYCRTKNAPRNNKYEATQDDS